MVVVTLIGFLAMLAVPGFKVIKLRALSASFVSDARSFSEAFQRYAQEKGSFPATAGVAVVPPGMEDYIASTDWTKTASIGGNYRWVNIPSSDPDRGPFEMGALMVAGATLSLEEFELIDGWIDDGSTNTGNFIVGGAGSMILYYVEN